MKLSQIGNKMPSSQMQPRLIWNVRIILSNMRKQTIALQRIYRYFFNYSSPKAEVSYKVKVYWMGNFFEYIERKEGLNIMRLWIIDIGWHTTWSIIIRETFPVKTVMWKKLSEWNRHHTNGIWREWEGVHAVRWLWISGELKQRIT